MITATTNKTTQAEEVIDDGNLNVNQKDDGGMNIIIPLGGIGSRFTSAGYDKPKPFINVLGKEMIFWVIDNLHLSQADHLIIVYNPSFMEMGKYMTEVFKVKYPNAQLVELKGPTRGAAETVLIGLQEGIMKKNNNRKRSERRDDDDDNSSNDTNYINDQLSKPCMLCDGDSFFTQDIVSKYRKISKTHNATFTFVDTQPKPIYSYVTVKPKTSDDGESSDDDVDDIKEKIKISDYANSGCYCFKSGVELAKYCKIIIDAGQTQLSQDMKGEFYTSGVIKAMLDDGIPCKRLEIPKEDMFVLGTPSQVTEFIETWPKRKRIGGQEDSKKKVKT